jgi:hypothetical protein
MKNRTIKRLFLGIAAVVLCALLSSCDEKTERFSSHSFDYFDTLTTITGYASDREAFDRVVDDIMRLLAICGARVRVARTIPAYPRTVEGDRSAARLSTNRSKASTRRGLSTSVFTWSANSAARRMQRRRSESVKE